MNHVELSVMFSPRLNSVLIKNSFEAKQQQQHSFQMHFARLLCAFLGKSPSERGETKPRHAVV